jgi:hypothetical protein
MLALSITTLTIQSTVKAAMRSDRTFMTGSPLVSRRAAPAQVARTKTMVVRVLMGGSLDVSTGDDIADCPPYSEF